MHMLMVKKKKKNILFHCYDAPGYTLSIKTKNFEKSVYNYCKYNETFDDIEMKFIDIVDRNKVYNFEDYLRNKYEEY